jgi:hypothetical protein
MSCPSLRCECRSDGRQGFDIPRCCANAQQTLTPCHSDVQLSASASKSPPPRGGGDIRQFLHVVLVKRSTRFGCCKFRFTGPSGQFFCVMVDEFSEEFGLILGEQFDVANSFFFNSILYWLSAQVN